MKKSLFIILLTSLSLSLLAQEGFKSYKEGGKYGVLDKSGKKINPAKYSDVSFIYYDGLCQVDVGNKSGYINKGGIELIPIIYDVAHAFKSGKALVCKDSMYYYINTKGEVVSPKYKISSDAGFSDVFTFLITDENGKKGFYSMWERKIMPNFYDIIYGAENGMHAVKINDKYGFNDANGNAIISVIYDEVFNFNEKVAIVRIGDKFGVIDKQGKMITPLVYYYIKDFSEGLAVVKKGTYLTGKKGYIDEKGNEVIPIIYEVAGDFKKGRAKVQIGNETFFIDKKGERIK